MMGVIFAASGLLVGLKHITTDPVFDSYFVLINSIKAKTK